MVWTMYQYKYLVRIAGVGERNYHSYFTYYTIISDGRAEEATKIFENFFSTKDLSL